MKIYNLQFHLLANVKWFFPKGKCIVSIPQSTIKNSQFKQFTMLMLYIVFNNKMYFILLANGKCFFSKGKMFHSLTYYTKYSVQAIYNTKSSNR